MKALSILVIILAGTLTNAVRSARTARVMDTGARVRWFGDCVATTSSNRTVVTFDVNLGQNVTNIYVDRWCLTNRWQQLGLTHQPDGREIEGTRQ